MARPFGTYKLTPEQLGAAWDEYKERCESFVKYQATAGKVVPIPSPLVYTVEDFCIYAGISRDTLNEYGNLPDYSDTVKSIKEGVFARKHRALVNGEGSTTGLIFDMKANYGINEKNIIEVNNTDDLSRLSDDELLMLAELQGKVRGK